MDRPSGHPGRSRGGDRPRRDKAAFGHAEPSGRFRRERRSGANAGRGPTRSRPDGSRGAAGADRPGAGWDHVAAWYDRLIGEAGSDYHRNVILPTALRLLDPQPGERFLDLCCGQGVLSRLLLEHSPAAILAVDASPLLIAAAKQRGHDPRVRYIVRDARRLGPLADGSFDAAACVMAVQDLDGIDELFMEMARALRPDGRAVLVMMHPCFRIPRQSEWGWDDAKRTQYRRIDRYAAPLTIPIATHPGAAPGQQTFFHHRPLADYINALGRAGLAIVAAEEPLTHRRAAPGGHSRGENRAAEEIPVFLGLKAVKVPGTA
ncbi:MAG: methyltransferase domain-containing protein [Planctomycetota bacterium]